LILILLGFIESSNKLEKKDWTKIRTPPPPKTKNGTKAKPKNNQTAK